MPPYSGYGWGYGTGPYISYWWGAPVGWTDLDLYDYNNDLILEDNEISDFVKDNIVADPGIPMSDANNIQVKVEDGKAILSGTVRNPRTNPLAYTDAYWTPGVLDVQDDIKVEPVEKQPKSAPASRGRGTQSK